MIQWATLLEADPPFAGVQIPLIDPVLSTTEGSPHLDDSSSAIRPILGEAPIQRPPEPVVASRSARRVACYADCRRDPDLPESDEKARQGGAAIDAFFPFAVVVARGHSERTGACRAREAAHCEPGPAKPLRPISGESGPFHPTLSGRDRKNQRRLWASRGSLPDSFFACGVPRTLAANHERDQRLVPAVGAPLSHDLVDAQARPIGPTGHATVAADCPLCVPAWCGERADRRACRQLPLPGYLLEEAACLAT